MSVVTLKDRIESLESEVKKLREELDASRIHRSKDWRRTIGAFTGDEGMQAILRDALKLRGADRKTAGRRKTSGGKSRR